MIKIYKSIFEDGNIKEAIPLSLIRPYLKNRISSNNGDIITGKDNFYSKNNPSKNNRVYIPLRDKTRALESLITEFEIEIKTSLDKDGRYELLDFINGKVLEKKYNRITKIGKALITINKKELLDKYNAFPGREGIKKSNLLVCISKHPYDILGQSYDRGWTSCKNLSDGKEAYYLKTEINRVLVAYLINQDDLNIRKPIARITILSFMDNTGNIKYIPQTKEYGTSGIWYELFLQTIRDFLDKKQGILNGDYTMVSDQYPDSLPTNLKINPKNRHVHEIEYTGNVSITGEYDRFGRVEIINGDVYLSAPHQLDMENVRIINGNLFISSPKLLSLSKLQKVTKNILIENCPNLKSLGNLQETGRDIYIFSKNMMDLGKLHTIGRDLSLVKSKIDSLMGLKNVGGILFLKGSNIKKNGKKIPPHLFGKCDFSKYKEYAE